MNSMRNALLAATLLGTGALLAADPYVGYIYPASVQAGTTTRLIVGGQNLKGVQSFNISGAGVRVVKTELVPGFPSPAGSQRRHLRNWLDHIAADDRAEPPLPANAKTDEWRANSWWSTLGTLDDDQLAIVERNLYTPRNPLQASPSLRQMMFVTVVVAPDAQPGRRTVIAESPAGLAAPRPLLVTREPHVVEPRYQAPHRKQPATPAADVRTGAVVLDGQIMPGETDAFELTLAGGRAYAFTVTGRELQPYIGDAVPGFFNPSATLKDADGKIVAFADDESRFQPDPILRFTQPKDGTYRLEIHDVLYRGRADFVYTILVDDFKARQPQPADGVVAAKGAVATQTFTIDAPGPRVLEVTARRRGSPLDAVLTLKKTKDGPVLAQWDDVTNKVFMGTVPQGECDPIGTYTFAEAGTYLAEITDRTGNGGPDYAWWLDVRRPNPGFAVFSTRSTLPLVRGVPLKIDFRITRQDGFDGDVTLEAPKGCGFTDSVITGGVDRLSTSLVFKGRGSLDTAPCQLFARAEIGGKTVRVPVVPCDEYEQAFAWKHLVPADAFMLRTRAGGKGAAPARGKGAKGKGTVPGKRPVSSFPSRSSKLI